MIDVLQKKAYAEKVYSRINNGNVCLHSFHYTLKKLFIGLENLFRIMLLFYITNEDSEPLSGMLMIIAFFKSTVVSANEIIKMF